MVRELGLYTVCSIACGAMLAGLLYLPAALSKAEMAIPRRGIPSQWPVTGNSPKHP